jgi:hypothetical protein
MIGAITAILSGCAASPQIELLKAEYANTIPTCSDTVAEQCEKMWEAAQVWVAQNAGYKIQIATSVLIETYNPVDYSTNLAVKVVKEATGSANYKFTVQVWCANLFGCRPNQHQAALDFNRKVNAAKSTQQNS